jgi:formamidopyrimidine-DNA glycosylase
MLLCEEGALDEHPMLAGLGIEPTGNALGGEVIADLFRDRATPLKSALLDQRLIAGVGNIYACEALWRAKLSPRRAAGSIAARPGKRSARAERLADALRSVIAEAIEAGGSSLRDHIRTDGTLGYFQHSFKVYDREGESCPRHQCSGVISRIAQAGRSTFYCPVCQR